MFPTNFPSQFTKVWTRGDTASAYAPVYYSTRLFAEPKFTNQHRLISVYHIPAFFEEKLPKTTNTSNGRSPRVLTACLTKINFMFRLIILPLVNPHGKTWSRRPGSGPPLHASGANLCTTCAGNVDYELTRLSAVLHGV